MMFDTVSREITNHIDGKSSDFATYILQNLFLDNKEK